jgi:hypothetical protein
MPGPRPRQRAIAAAILAVAALVLGIGAPAYAGPPAGKLERYVALGDSYASGEGAGLYRQVGAPNPCGRTLSAYPELIDDPPEINLIKTAACSGATIASVRSSQLSDLTRGTTLVTLTVGSTDLGVSEFSQYCYKGGIVFGCDLIYSRAMDKLAQRVIARDLAALIDAIADKSPKAEILVTDYPVPVVADGSRLSNTAAKTNRVVSGLNEQIRAAVQTAAAAGADVRLVSVAAAFVGHEAGSSAPWIGADPLKPTAFLQPTAAGQEAYAEAILDAVSD